MSSGKLAYEFDHDHPTGPLGEFQATTDEERGLFYVSTGGLTSNDEPGFRILSLKGEDGTRVRSFVTAAEDNAPELGYDPIRDVILIHRTDKWTIELRDPIVFTLLGEISLPDHPDGWMEARILVDPDTDRAFVIYSAGWKDGGPPNCASPCTPPAAGWSRDRPR